MSRERLSDKDTLVRVWSRLPRALSTCSVSEIRTADSQCGMQVRHHLGATPLLRNFGVLKEAAQGSRRGKNVMSIGICGNLYRLRPVDKWKKNAHLFHTWARGVAEHALLPNLTMRAWIKVSAAISTQLNALKLPVPWVRDPAGYHSSWYVRCRMAVHHLGQLSSVRDSASSSNQG